MGDAPVRSLAHPVRMAPAPPYATLLFDLDGTLIDSVGLIFASYNHTLQVHRGEQRGDDYWVRMLGTPLRTQLAEFSDDPVEVEAMATTYREHNHGLHDELVQAYDGVVDLIEEVHRRGTPMGLVTSKSRGGARRGLNLLGVTERFETLVCLEDVTQHKPHPAPVLAALERLSAAPEGAVYVGDSPHDLIAGRAAGTATAAVAWGPFPRADLEACAPDHFIEHPSELLALL